MPTFYTIIATVNEIYSHREQDWVNKTYDDGTGTSFDDYEDAEEALVHAIRSYGKYAELAEIEIQEVVFTDE